jgi:CRISPR-associated protein Cas5d
MNLRRNEVKSRISADSARSVMNGRKRALYINTKDDIQQRAALVLRDVHYVIEAHFELTEAVNPTDNAGKFADITRRRIEHGQCYHQPYLGCREFPANFRPYREQSTLTAYPDSERDLGYMLYDMDYSDPDDIKPVFFRALLKNGILDLRDCGVVR